MLTINGRTQTFCDGVSRRSFLHIGGLAIAGMASLTLPEVLRAEALAGAGSRHKGVINIFLGGGAPHQDMWEIKTDAPKEIRGEFSPIATKIAGIEIGETFPLIAAKMDKFVVIRSVVGNAGGHDAFQVLSGWDRNSITSVGGRPSIGSVVAKLGGPVDPGVPPFVALADKTQHAQWSEPGAPGFLGAAFKAFKPQGEGMADLRLNTVSSDRLQDRKSLLRGLDNLKREVDATG
ncbi:MAG: hypothetical protein JWN70_4199, partial [Planctomycetaceae bacterium]|nr:hypothetical protein [Planctomycetaceae bacterium]